MIEWFESAARARTFLGTPDREWSYGDAADELNRHVVTEPTIVAPGDDPERVFEILAGIAGGGVVVLAPAIETPAITDLSGTSLVVFTSCSRVHGAKTVDQGRGDTPDQIGESRPGGRTRYRC